ncbi:MAG: glutamyl-tRNA reductase [Rhodospirillales bacterium]|jgi:glutamyl-tRNA reductase
MVATSIDTREVLIVGANHRSSSMGIRDRLFVEDADISGMHKKLQARGIYQALILSTCDRTEVTVIHRSGDDTATRIIEALAEHADVSIAELANQLYVLSNVDAVQHIFQVAASLDSLVIGEPQVLGQVKAAHRLSRTCGAVGSDLEALLQSTYETAKRVRTETNIGEGPVSLAAATVQLARDLHGDLQHCNALVVGTGDMGSLIAISLRDAGLQQITLTHPTPFRVEGMARDLNCHVAPFEQLADQLIEADIVLAAMGRRHHTMSAALMTGAIDKRRHKPVLLIDTSLPGDIEPAVSRLDDAFVYDLNDLEHLAVTGRADRQNEAEKATAIVEMGVRRYMRHCAEQTAAPVLTLLHQHFESERQLALKNASQDAEKATRLFMNRLLHMPSEVLRESAADEVVTLEGWRSVETAVKRLFGLNIRVVDTANQEEGEK